MVAGARPRSRRVQEMGGAVAGRRDRLHEAALVASHAAAAPADRGRRGRGGRRQPVRDHEPNPLTADLDAAIQTVDHDVEAKAVAAVRAWREQRDADPAGRRRRGRRWQRCAPMPAAGANLMPASLEAARAGVTTGEWAAGAARGVRRVPRPHGCVRLGRGRRRRQRRAARRCARGAPHRRRARRAAADAGRQAGPRRPQQRRRAGRGPRPDAGFEVIYQGIRLTPGADRRGRRRRGRAPRRHLDPVRLAHGAGARDPRAACATPGPATCR